jgi:cell wall-associated NlpC family hydrolase
LRRAVRLASLTAGAALGASLLVAPAATADPKPTRESVEQAYEKVEAVTEEVNGLTERIDRTQEEIDALSRDIAGQEAAFREQRDALGAAVVQQQIENPLGPTVGLLGSEDPTAFLDGLGAVQALNASRADQLDQFSRTAAQMRNRQAQLAERKKELAADKRAVLERRQAIRAAYEKAKAAHDRLEARERARMAAADDQVDPSGIKVDVTGRAGEAVKFALAQLGDPYSWGGNGPDSWDCSGLTGGAWASAGVSLPRTARAQVGAGQKISMSELQPGDLVAYSSLTHIGMYIGDGKVVHAPRTGLNVSITSLSSFQIAVRVG